MFGYSANPEFAEDVTLATVFFERLGPSSAALSTHAKEGIWGVKFPLPERVQTTVPRVVHAIAK